MRPTPRHLAVSIDEQGLASKTGGKYPEEHFRVNWAISNCDEFYQAYDCHSGDGMFLPEEQRVTVW